MCPLLTPFVRERLITRIRVVPMDSSRKSRLVIWDCILYHQHYYNIEVGQWHNSGCKKTIGTNGATLLSQVVDVTVDVVAPKVDFSKSVCQTIAASGKRVALDFES
jgi:hypothetical protein